MNLPSDASLEFSPARFAESGICVVRGLIDAGVIKAFRQDSAGLMAAKLGVKIRDGISHNEYSDLANRLESNMPMAGFFRACKNLASFCSLCSVESMIQAVDMLVGGPSLFLHDISLFRIDPKDDEAGRAFLWHQDYQYNMASLESVTAWIPAFPVTPEMGGVGYVPGSHKEILPVELVPSTQGTNRWQLQLDRNIAEREMLSLNQMNVGDVAFFHPLLLHRSLENQSSLARVTVNPRYANGTAHELLNRNWATTDDRDADLFLRIHSELVNSSSTD